MMGDPDAARHLGGVQAPSVVWRAMMSNAGAWALTGISMFSVIEKTSGVWVGRMGPWKPHGWPGNEIGWSLHPDSQGKGYAQEGATAAMDYAFDLLGWSDVIHCIDPDNVASQKLAERLGSRLHGETRMPAPYDDLPVDAWGQTREDWRARARQR